MKKQLLTTTALVAAGAIGAVAVAGSAYAQKGKKPFITVNGYHEQVIGAVISSEDRPGAPTAGTGFGDNPIFDQHTETEVHFNGHAKLDNGITLRAHWELEGHTQTAVGGDDIDEVYLIIRGSFGQVTLGSEDNAAHLMTIGFMGSWATGVGQNLAFDVSDWVQHPGGTLQFDATFNDVRMRSEDNDSEKISYYTPRFEGFQLGFSYIPVFNQDLNAFATSSATYHDGIAIGLNFDRKFDQVGIGLAVGYMQAQTPDGFAPGAGSVFAGTEDLEVWGFGARIDFGGFRVAFGWKENDGVRDAAGASGLTSHDGNIWEVGGRYRWGPNAVSLTFQDGEYEDSVANPGTTERQAAMLSYRRALAPGVRWTANLIWGSIDHEVIGNGNEGAAVSTSIRLGF